MSVVPSNANIIEAGVIGPTHDAQFVAYIEYVIPGSRPRSLSRPHGSRAAAQTWLRLKTPGHVLPATAHANPMIPLSQTAWKDVTPLTDARPYVNWTAFPPGFEKPYYPRYKVDGYYEDFNPAPRAVANRGRDHRLKKVPTLKATPRSAADHISAIGGPRNRGKETPWPIGDLYHARLALMYILSPSHASVRRRVARSVQSHYPEYDWARWWDLKARGKKLPSWDALVR